MKKYEIEREICKVYLDFGLEGFGESLPLASFDDVAEAKKTFNELLKGFRCWSLEYAIKRYCKNSDRLESISLWEYEYDANGDLLDGTRMGTFYVEHS